ncbi:MAG: hypothetical protein IKG30_01825 [Clostridiales bacterium]|jgi:hypothetical protein|nr:hypothetical protein [Clostridiales bacterium]
MENKGVVEMAVVCSDLSLLENINSLLKQKGVIAVEDEFGALHYIVDGRNNRQAVAGRVTAINPNSSAINEKEEAFLEICIKTVLREYGFDLSLIGTVLIYNSIFLSFKRCTPLPATMKGLYCETGKDLGLNYEQAERDVRYAITKSSLKNMRSRAAMRCIYSRIERRLGYIDPLE